jgi:uncharacterized protein (DUF1330 family)
MAAYLIGDIQIHDPVAYANYSAAIPALIRKHRGEPLVRGGAVTVFEGDWNPGRLVVFRFPDMVAVRAFLEDPEYRPWKELRQSASIGNLIGVEGI